MFASGRWHEAPRRIIYASDHPASALLELLVHLNPVAKPKHCQLLKIKLPGDILLPVTSKLPDGWQSQSTVTQTIGNQWLDQNQSAAFSVPSAIVPDAKNYLINPLHADARHIKIESVQSVPLDERLK